MAHSHLVVNLPPHQDSVLGRIVAESRLGEIFQAIHRWMVLGRAVAETQAQLAALRAACTHKLSEFAPYESAPVDRNDEPLFALSVNEYCEAFPHLIVFANDEGQVTGTCTQAQLLAWLLQAERDKKELRQRAYATYYAALQLRTKQSAECERERERKRKSNQPAERISTREELDDFFDSIARGAGVGDTWRDCAAPQFELSERSKSTTRRANPVGYETLFSNQDVCLTPYERRKVNTNWCPVCKEYVAMSHDGPKGIACKKYIVQRTRREAAHLAKMREQTHPVVTRKPLEAWKDGPIHQNYVEDRMIACVDQLRLNAVQLALNHTWNSKTGSECEEAALKPVRQQRKGKRHYVRHGAAELHFVRQQDLKLATNI